ncbi:biotin-dependent carboxyltransferase family protein [Kangiella japonica]|uniref:Biotin-dependent carboxyltransferase family protein n=1 Tax=Kangiella japonica TaxID=647384 RepID=A0ABN0SUQ8_9GAMM
MLKAGVLSTIQDLGRPNYLEYGVSRNGALDEYSHQIANWLVGNPKSNATIEVTQVGPSLEFTEDHTVAVAGASFKLTLNDSPCPMNTTLHLKAGDVLTFGKLLSGARAYIAIAGEVNLTSVMGSLSTNLLAGFGGYKGRALEDGDEIKINRKPFDETRVTPKELSVEHHHSLQQHHFVVRFTQGKEYELLTGSSKQSLVENDYSVSGYSNRMAIKLESDKDALHLSQELSMTTAPIVSGTVQLPPSGHPIVILADGQTTGGYPRVGQVISADLSLLAQLKANDTLSFYPVTVEEALTALSKKNSYFDSVLNN